MIVLSSLLIVFTFFHNKKNNEIIMIKININNYYNIIMNIFIYFVDDFYNLKND